MSTNDLVFRIDAETGDTLETLRRVESAVVDLAQRTKASTEKSAESFNVWSASISELVSKASARFNTFTGGMIRAETIIGGLQFAAAGAAAGLVAFGGAIAYGVKMAVEADESHNRLVQAMRRTGLATADNIAQLDAMADEISRTTRTSDEAARELMALGLDLGVGGGKIKDFTAATLDMSAALGISAEQAARQLAGTLDGTAAKLASVIPELQGLTEEQLKHGDAIKVVQRLYGGAAAGDASTLSGALAQFKNMASEAFEQFGVGITGASDMAGAVRDATEWIGKMLPVIKRLGEAVGEVAGRFGKFMEAMSFVGASDASQFAGSQIGKLMSIKEELAQLPRRISEVRAQLDSLTSGKAGRDGSVDVITPDGRRVNLEANEYNNILNNRKALLADLETKQRTLPLLESALAYSAEKTTAAERAKGSAAGDALTALTGQLDVSGELERNFAGAAAEAEKVKQTLREQLMDIRAMAIQHGYMSQAIEGGSLALDDQVRAFKAMESEATSARTTLDTLFIGGKIGSEEYAKRLAEVEGGLAAIKEAAKEATEELERQAQVTAAIKAGDAFQAKQRAAAPIGPEFAPGAMNPEDIMGPVPLDQMGAQQQADQAGFLAQRAAQEAEAHQQRLAQIAEIATATGSLTEALAQVNTELERQGAATIALSDAQTKQIASQMRQEARMRAAHQVGQMWRGGLQQIAGGLIEMAITGEGSVKKLVAATLKGLAVEAGTKAIMQVAEGLAALARHDPGAAAHFASAKTFGLVAVAAGAGAAALGGGGSSGGGGGADSAGRDPGASRETLAERATPNAEPAGPRTQLVITGQFHGATSPEEWARQANQWLANTDRETGNRARPPGL